MTRGKALSDDARSILLKLHQSDEFTMDHLSALTDVHRRTIYRIIQHWEATGAVERDGKRTGRRRLLDYPDVQVSCSVPALTDVAHQDSICRQYLLSSIDHRRDLFLDELREKLGASSGKYVSDSTIWRTLERAGFTMKKVWCFVFNWSRPNPTWSKISKKARERSETARIRYRLKIGEMYEAEQLVFVDESACDRRTFLRKKAWALRGHQASRKQFFARGKRYA